MKFLPVILNIRTNNVLEIGLLFAGTVALGLCLGFLIGTVLLMKKQLQCNVSMTLFTKEESYRMIDNTHNLNRQIAVTMAICTTFLICLLLLDFFAVFNFSEELMFAISVIGIPTLISPLILCFFKVPDKFLKYYMSVAMSVLIGMFGCFNDIGIYITFVLVPVASCLYFDVYYTMFCSVFSYIVMVISVYLNSAGRLEITYLGWSHRV